MIPATEDDGEVVLATRRLPGGEGACARSVGGVQHILRVLAGCQWEGQLRATRHGATESGGGGARSPAGMVAAGGLSNGGVQRGLRRTELQPSKSTRCQVAKLCKVGGAGDTSQGAFIIQT